MATERQVLGQAQRVLVDATNQIWHKISLWTHVSDVEMNDGTPLNEFLTDMNDDLSDRIDGKYNSYNITTTNIANLSQIPEVGYSRVATTVDITAGDYTIPANHYCYCYSGKDPNSIEKMAVMIDTTDLSSIVMYIAHYSIEARWTLTKIATQKQIDNLQDQINNLSNEFNRLNMFVESSVGNLNARYNIIQNQMDWLEAELAELQEFLNDLLNELRDFKREINGRVDGVEKIFRILYGNIGSIYLSAYQDANFGEVLEQYFGGKWVLIQGAYLYAAVFGGDESEQMVMPISNEHYTTKQINGEVSLSPAARDRLNRDYSPIFSGRKELVLDKSNLPKHFHKVGDYAPYKRQVMMSWQPRNDYDSYPLGKAWADHHIPWGGEENDYITLGVNLKDVVTVGPNHPTTPGGKFYIEPDVGSNEYPGENLSQPVDLNPTRFRVYVWCRVA